MVDFAEKVIHPDELDRHRNTTNDHENLDEHTKGIPETIICIYED